MNNCVIYKISVGKAVGKKRKIYIGSSIHGLRQRQSEHLNSLRQNIHHNRHLQNYFNKYGENTFEFSIVEKVKVPENILAREQHWIDKLKPEFNVMRNVKSHIGVTRSLATRRKISAALRGRKRSQSTIEKMRRAFVGKPHDPKMMKALHENNKKPIKQIYPDGRVVMWNSATEAAASGDYNRPSIYRCIYGGRVTHKNCRWEHA